MLSSIPDVGILEGIPGWNTACIYFAHTVISASVNPQVSTVTTAGRHLSEFPGGSITYTILPLDCSAVSVPGRALNLPVGQAPFLQVHCCGSAILVPDCSSDGCPEQQTEQVFGRGKTVS